jgi:hypothetical protein
VYIGYLSNLRFGWFILKTTGKNVEKVSNEVLELGYLNGNGLKVKIVGICPMS